MVAGKEGKRGKGREGKCSPLSTRQYDAYIDCGIRKNGKDIYFRVNTVGTNKGG